MTTGLIEVSLPTCDELNINLSNGNIPLTKDPVGYDKETNFGVQAEVLQEFSGKNRRGLRKVKSIFKYILERYTFIYE